MLSVVIYIYNSQKYIHLWHIGVKGAYCGGDWIDIEDCDKQFNIKNGSGSACAACPRSKTKKTSIKGDGTYDVIVIGAGKWWNISLKVSNCIVQIYNDAHCSYCILFVWSKGCIGGAIARELSKKNLSVLVLESADDVTQGATKGNNTLE